MTGLSDPSHRPEPVARGHTLHYNRRKSITSLGARAVTPILNSILELLKSLFGGGAASADEPTPSSAATVPEADPDTTLGVGSGDEDLTRSHALVLPDADFRNWYEATRNYTNHFGNVIIVRSPAGNNLNRYKTITAVRTGRTWFNGDPVAHIRRAYPVVVNVDVVEASTPAALKQALDGRVVAKTRFGPGMKTRFTLDWPTDSYALQIIREFDAPMGDGKRHEGIDIAVTAGTAVRTSCAGSVFSVIPDNDTLGYGTHVQIRAEAQDGTDYLVTHTNLTDIRVNEGQSLAEGDLLGVAAGDRTKLVVQQGGKNTGSRYRVSGAIDPVPLIYVDGLTLVTTADSGLNIRRGRGTEYEKVGLMASTDSARSLEMHGITIRKTGTPPDDNQWINVDTSAGVTGFAAGWFLTAKSPRSAASVNTMLNGINLDVLTGIGRPDPSRLGAMTYARFAYNVSRGRGSQDLDAAKSIYAPYIDALRRANKKVILVYTHQTYGEGAGYVWPQMSDDQWRELSDRFAEYVRVIARTYKGQIAAHQIWNEQDAPPNAAASVTLSTGTYAYMLTRAIQAIRAEDPNTPIITGGHTAGPQLGSNYARQTFAAMPAGIRPDGVAAHPYGRGRGATPKYEQFGDISETVREYSAVLPGRPIWITEWGVLNANSEPASEIAKYATSVLEYIRTKQADKVAAMVWYAWAEGMHNGYGLVNSSQQPREPLYSSYTSVK